MHFDQHFRREPLITFDWTKRIRWSFWCWRHDPGLAVFKRLSMWVICTFTCFLCALNLIILKLTFGLWWALSALAGVHQKVPLDDDQCMYSRGISYVSFVPWQQPWQPWVPVSVEFTWNWWLVSWALTHVIWQWMVDFTVHFPDLLWRNVFWDYCNYNNSWTCLEFALWVALHIFFSKRVQNSSLTTIVKGILPRPSIYYIEQRFSETWKLL